MLQTACVECGKVNGLFKKSCSQCKVDLPARKTFIVSTVALAGIILAIKIITIGFDILRASDLTSTTPTIDSCSKVFNLMQEKNHVVTQKEADLLSKCVSE